MDVNIEMTVVFGTAALAAGTVAYLLVKGVLSVNDTLERGGRSALRELLALPGAFIERRRNADRALKLKLEELDRLRTQAGGRFLEGATAPEILAAKYVLPALALAAIVLFGTLLRLPGGLVFVGALFFAVLLYAWPESALRQEAQRRTTQFVHDLPMVLDVMRIVSQAGGDLQSSVTSAVGVIDDSPVREELRRMMKEVAVGTSFAVALNRVGERVGTPEASAVFSTLSQSLEMGTSVSDNLKSISGLIRHSQRVKAQAKAQKAVVAMTFPLLLLILPGVFIVLFAPLVIRNSQNRAQVAVEVQNDRK